MEISVEEPDLDPVADLARRAREGDRDAFEALARRNLGRLFGLAVRICRDEQFARDAV